MLKLLHKLFTTYLSRTLFTTQINPLCQVSWIFGSFGFGGSVGCHNWLIGDRTGFRYTTRSTSCPTQANRVGRIQFLIISFANEAHQILNFQFAILHFVEPPQPLRPHISIFKAKQMHNVILYIQRLRERHSSTFVSKRSRRN